MKNFVKGYTAAFCSLALTLVLLTNVPLIYAQQECDVISTGAPAPTTGSIAAGDTAQTGRLFRDGRGSTCTLLRTPPNASAGNYLSDQYTFTNNTGQGVCVYVDLNATGCGVASNQISMAAYTTYNPAAPTANLIGDPGLSTGSAFANSMNFFVPAGGSYTIVVHNVNAGTFCGSYTFTQTYARGCRQPGFDSANDGSADLALFRPSGGLAQWFSQPVTGGTPIVTQFGSAGDIPVPGDYNGDEATDLAVYRPGASSIWYTSTNPANNYGARYWGTTGDVPVQGDYDRDGITDLAVFRPSDNNWYILRSSTNSFLQVALGTAGDKPVPADYDGDGKTDVAIFRPSNGNWIYLSSAGAYGTFQNAIHGTSTDIPVPADYDGDAKADFAVFRPSEGNWYILRTSLAALGVGQNQVVRFGLSGDMPQPADYDGDKKVDQAVFRPSNSTWYINRSTAGFIQTQFGATGDIPASAANTNTIQ